MKEPELICRGFRPISRDECVYLRENDAGQYVENIGKYGQKPKYEVELNDLTEGILAFRRMELQRWNDLDDGRY